MNETSTAEEVYLTPGRRRVRCRLVPLRDRTVDAPAHPLLDLVPVLDEDSGRELLRVSVRDLGDGRVQDRTRAFAALDNEILAGVRLARAAPDSPPAELSRLIGYHDDPSTPFALLEPYRGEPVEVLTRKRRLFEEERTAFRESLFRALFRLESCGLVHRDIRPATVRWDGERRSVQLCGFTRATVAGVAREAVGGGPWAAKEQREGAGLCDPRDDVWSAGLVLFQALSGHDVASGAVLPVHEHPELAELLTGVFEPTAQGRPTAGALLERVSGTLPPRRPGFDDHLQQGRLRFRSELGRKREENGVTPPADTVEPPRREYAGPARSEEDTPVDPASRPVNEPPSGVRGHGRLVALLLMLVAASVALFLYFG